MQAIGEKIKELRKTKGISQEELAFELGVSRQTVHKWENGKVQPSTENLKMTCDYFQVSSNYFFDNTDAVKEVAITDGTNKSKKSLVVASIILTITILLLIVSICFTAFIGFIVFSNNSGNSGNTVVSIFVMDNYVFYLFLALSLILIAINVVMIFHIKK